jgi:hypothetical protein
MVKYANTAFILVALFAALSTGPTAANGLSNMQPIVRRHPNLVGSDKMVRKIKRQGGIPILGGGGENTGTGTGTGTPTGKASDTGKPADTKTADPTNTSNTSNTSTNTPTNTPVTDTKSTSNTSNTSTGVSTPSTAPSQTTPPPATVNTGSPTIKKTGSVVLVTATDSGTPTPSEPAATASAFSPKTWIILGSIVGGIIVVAALWTVIRKWKFSPSRKFEDRLEPIDWQPGQDAATGAAAGAGAAGGAALTRANSHGSQRSGPTADEYHNRNMYAPSVAPEYPDMYGGAAYADMHRGGTPQPQMDQLNHGPVYARGPYDGYDNAPAPYHPHQHAQDPYGGYAEHEYGAPAGPYRGY